MRVHHGPSHAGVVRDVMPVVPGRRFGVTAYRTTPSVDPRPGLRDLGQLDLRRRLKSDYGLRLKFSEDEIEGWVIGGRMGRLAAPSPHGFIRGSTRRVRRSTTIVMLPQLAATAG